MSQAQAQRESARWNMLDARFGVAERVISAYAEWYRSHLRLKAATYGIEAHERLLDQITRRVQGGLSPDADQGLAQARMLLARSDLTAAQAAQSAALAQLQQLVGHEVQGTELARELPSLPQHSGVQPLLQRSLESAPALHRAEQDMLALQSELRSRQANAWPQVYVRAERQLGSYTDVSAAPVNRLVLGVQLSPGAGLSNAAHADAVAARYQSAMDSRDALRRDITEKVQLAYLEFDAARARGDNLVATGLANEQVLQSYERQFLVGRKSWLDLMNAVREVTQTQMTLADARASVLSQGWRLHLYAGDLPLDPAAQSTRTSSPR